jgi:hypothetical protein
MSLDLTIDRGRLQGGDNLSISRIGQALADFQFQCQQRQLNAHACAKLFSSLLGLIGVAQQFALQQVGITLADVGASGQVPQ